MDGWLSPPFRLRRANALIFAELAVNYNTVDELTGFLDAASITTLPIPPHAAFAASHAFFAQSLQARR